MSFTSLIVTYNSADEVPDLLADLRLHSPSSHLIVVDNASQDRTADIVQSQYPEVQLISNIQNVGYAKAVNQGFDLCDSEYVLLLNPDIRITTLEFFRALLERMEHSPRVAAVAPLQFKHTHKGRHLNFTWSYWTPRALGVYLSYLMQRRPVFEQPIPVTFLNAGCLLIRRSAFLRVGKLNEKYFLYGEEPDLFLKFKRYGFECWLLPNVGVIHYRERSLKAFTVTQRMRTKLQAVHNICDALLAGYTRIMLDKLSGNQPERMD